MRSVLGRLTTNRVTSLVFGALVTVMLQSSGATSVMLVSFAETEFITLAHAVAVLLGADIGTTFTVFLLSLQKVTDYALMVVAVGFALQAMARQRRTKHMGAVILGFGLVFYGMYLMATAASPLKENPLAMQAFTFLSGNPLATLVVATLLSGAIHSAATIGIAMALGLAGALSFESAVPLVLGANVGTCVTVLLSALHAGVPARRVAAAHVMTKVTGVVMVYPFLEYFVRAIEWTTQHIVTVAPMAEPGIAGRIVMVHVLFNIALAIVFLPLVHVMAKLIASALPLAPSKVDEEFRPKYLTPSALETPALAFAQVKREILRIAALVSDQVDHCLLMFDRHRDAAEEIEKIAIVDDRIDALEKSTRFYLARLSSENLSDEEADRQLVLLSIGQDLEEVGDIVSREMVALARKKANKRYAFSDEGWNDLGAFHLLVKESCAFAIAAIAQPAEALVAKAKRHEEHLGETEQELRQNHLVRLYQGMKESFDTSSIHLDVLSNMRRIGSQLTHIVSLSTTL